MTDLTTPGEVNATIDNRTMSKALQHAGGHDGYVVDGVDLAENFQSLDDGYIQSFDVNYTGGLEATYYGGEAYVGGWLATDDAKTVTLPANSSTTTYVGIDMSAILDLDGGEDATDSDNVIVGTDDDFDDLDPRTPLHEFVTGDDEVESYESVRSLSRAEAPAPWVPEQGGTFGGSVTIEGALSAESLDVSGDGEVGGGLTLGGDLRDVDNIRGRDHTRINFGSSWTLIDADGAERIRVREYDLISLESDTDVEGDLDVDGAVDAGGDAGVGGDLDVDGAADVGGDLDVGGSEIDLPNASGDEGLQLGGGVAFSYYEGYATAYAYTDEGAEGFRVRNPDGPGDLLNVDASSGDAELEGDLTVDDGDPVVSSGSGEYEIQVDGSDGSGIINFKTS